jgi:hypothetical protein
MHLKEVACSTTAIFASEVFSSKSPKIQINLAKLLPLPGALRHQVFYE